MADTKAKQPEAVTSQPSPQKRTFGSRLGSHLKKWWWTYIGSLAIMVLVVIFPIVYVAYPKIARRDVNKSTLSITHMVISDPAPQSFTLHQTQIINTKSSFHPWIYGFEAGVSIAKAPKPFISVQVPKVKSDDGAVVEISQRVNISDVSSFQDFAKTLLMQDKVLLNIHGGTKLKEGVLPKVPISYNKTVEMKGLDGLKGFNVTKLQILQEPNNGRNMEGTVFIPNPSVTTIALGNVTFDLYSQNKQMGQAYLDNLVIKPGNNTVPIAATIDEIAVFKLVTTGIRTSKDGVVPFTIIGNSIIYDNKQLPFFTEALGANNLTFQVNVTQVLQELTLS